MPSYVALLRGINVGGKNMIRMPELAACFADGGYEDARTYIQSGNVLFTSDETDGRALEQAITALLEQRFGLALVVVVRSRDELAATIDAAPAEHGAPHLRSDVLFLKHPLSAEDALAQLPQPREGVDAITPGPGAIYWSRVDAQATKSRLSRVTALPVYQQMTVRNRNTTTKLLALLDG